MQIEPRALNMRRRHMDTSQRAMAGARIKSIFEEDARRRQEASRAKPGEAAHLRALANLPAPNEQSKPTQAPRNARDDAAAAVNISPRSVENASKVLRDGSEALVKAVDGGENWLSREHGDLRTDEWEGRTPNKD